MKLLLKIGFIGTNYEGFQSQPSGRGIQNILTAAAEKTFLFACDVTGCSRTDAGVHANGFCCTVEPRGEHIESWCTIPTEKIHRAFAPNLPCDIAVIAAAEVPCDFHARYSVLAKEYIYKIWDSPVANPFNYGRVYRCNTKISEEAEKQMTKAASAFVGKHDFTALMASGSKITDCVREVKSASVKREADGTLVFTVSADGFLYNMVRIMAGTLIDVAKGKISADSLPQIIKLRNRECAGFTAPAHGLYLNQVYYNEEIIWKCS